MCHLGLHLSAVPKPLSNSRAQPCNHLLREKMLSFLFVNIMATTLPFRPPFSIYFFQIATMLTFHSVQCQRYTHLWRGQRNDLSCCLYLHAFVCVLWGLQKHSIIHLYLESIHRDWWMLGQSLGKTLFHHFSLLLFILFIYFHWKFLWPLYLHHFTISSRDSSKPQRIYKNTKFMNRIGRQILHWIWSSSTLRFSPILFFCFLISPSIPFYLSAPKRYSPALLKPHPKK